MIERLMNKENRQAYLYNKRLRERIIIPYAREVFLHFGCTFEGLRAKNWRFKCRRIMCEGHDDAWLVTCRRIFKRNSRCVMFTYNKQEID
jgi:hypothetical protein